MRLFAAREGRLILPKACSGPGEGRFENEVNSDRDVCVTCRNWIKNIEEKFLIG